MLILKVNLYVFRLFLEVKWVIEFKYNIDCFINVIIAFKK